MRETKAGQSYRHLVEERTKALVDSGAMAWHGDDTGLEPDYFYRPNQLLIAAEALPALADALQELKAGDPEHDEALGVAMVPLPAGSDVHDAVQALRKTGKVGPESVGPHHVLFGVPKWHACPGRPPFPAPPAALDAAGEAGAGVLIAVIDTGQADSSLKDAWVGAHVRVDPADIDVLDEDSDGVLDFVAGHGTFVTGVVAQVAPGADVLVLAALSPSGVTDDLAAARAVVKARAHGAAIVNLSFGCYGEGDAVPLALARALAAKDGEPFVAVAAAGNDALSRPFFPAALPGVISVAALNASGRRAGFSNFGKWVDACADGERVLSTFVTGEVMTDADGDGQREVFDAPYAYWSGTSFAAPQVSAALAVRMSEHGETAVEAAQALVFDPALARRPGVGTRVETHVRSHRSAPGLP